MLLLEEEHPVGVPSAAPLPIAGIDHQLLLQTQGLMLLLLLLVELGHGGQLLLEHRPTAAEKAKVIIIV